MIGVVEDKEGLNILKSEFWISSQTEGPIAFNSNGLTSWIACDKQSTKNTMFNRAFLFSPVFYLLLETTHFSFILTLLYFLNRLTHFMLFALNIFIYRNMIQLFEHFYFYLISHPLTVKRIYQHVLAVKQNIWDF